MTHRQSSVSSQFKIFSFIICFITFLPPISRFFPHPLFPFNARLIPINRSTRITIAILCKSTYSKEIQYWSDHFVPQFYSQPYADFISFWGEIPSIPPHFINVSYRGVDIQNDLSRHGLNLKLKAAIENFLYETTSTWFFRIVGDTAVNFETVPLVLRDLESDFDPLTDTVIQGACLGKLQLTYIQGGSGFIFSRKAAFELLNDWSWIEAHVEEFNNDDRLLSVYLQKVNISFKKATNRFFVGHSFWRFENAYEAITAEEYKECPILPKSKKGCRSHFTKVKELAFWHDRTTFERFIGRIEEIRELVRDNLYFYVPNNKPVLCESNKELSGYYD
jgi:hypothetical protein